MSVYIPGMEMPTSCSFCRFCDGLADTQMGTCAFCMVDGKYRDARTNCGCPLVPVPEHGDLIDRQVLLKLIEYPDDDGRFGYLDALDITCAPTIIPADKEEQT